MSATERLRQHVGGTEDGHADREQEAEQRCEAEIAPAHGQRRGFQRQVAQESGARVDAYAEQDRHPQEAVGVGTGKGEQRCEAGDDAFERSLDDADDAGEDARRLGEPPEVERQLIAQPRHLQPQAEQEAERGRQTRKYERVKEGERGDADDGRHLAHHDDAVRQDAQNDHVPPRPPQQQQRMANSSRARAKVIRSGAVQQQGA